MKCHYCLTIYFVLSIISNTRGQEFTQNAILNLLYNHDEFVAPYMVDSTRSSIRLNPFFLNFPDAVFSYSVGSRGLQTIKIKSKEYFKDNIEIRNKIYKPSSWNQAHYALYNHEGNIIESINQFDPGDKLQYIYDSLRRPLQVFSYKNGIPRLSELATYTDSTVQITRFNAKNEMIKQQEFPYILHQNVHVKNIEYSKHKRKKTVLQIHADYPEYLFKMIYNLDARGNWVLKNEYIIIGDTITHISRTKRKIYYSN